MYKSTECTGIVDIIFYFKFAQNGLEFPVLRLLLTLHTMSNTFTFVCLLNSVIDFHFGRLVLEIIATLVKSSEIFFFYSTAHFLTIFIVMGQTTCDCCFACIILNALTVHHWDISSNSTMSKRHPIIIIVQYLVKSNSNALFRAVFFIWHYFTLKLTEYMRRQSLY